MTATVEDPPRARGAAGQCAQERRCEVRDREFQRLIESMLDRLSEQQDRRDEYEGTAWFDAAIDVMHHAVNSERRERGLAAVDRGAIERIERMALGHSDYSQKFALYCAELAVWS